MGNAFTAYVTAPVVLGELEDPVGREQAAALLDEARVSRVVLESYRDGCVVEAGPLEELRDFFRGRSFSVLGSLMPTPGKRLGKVSQGLETRVPSLCYSDEDTVAALEGEVRKLARLFDTVVVADGFLTSCRCAECEARRAGRRWTSYRTALLSQVAERWVQAGREENPSVRIVVKFPPFYDRRRQFGCDAKRFPEIFDAVWVGTETRNPETGVFGHTEPYQGYFNALWMRACAGDKFEAAWFDYEDCDEQLFYEQGVTTYLGAPRDVTISPYSAAAFQGSRIRRLAQAAPALRQLREAAESPRGVHVVKPPNSMGGHDLYVYDYLGMLGIPCIPAVTANSSMRSIFIPAHGIEDAEVRAAIPKALAAGRQVTVTFEALRRMAGYPELLEFFGYTPARLAPGRTKVRAFEIGNRTIEAVAPFHVPGDLAPVDAAVLAQARVEEGGAPAVVVPFVTARSFSSGGRAVVWNLATFGKEAFNIHERFHVPVRPELLELPKEIVDFLRLTVTQPLGITIEAPVRVASFIFARHLAFVNYESSPAEIQIRGADWAPESLVADSPNSVCSGDTLLLAPRSYALLRYTATF